MAGKFDDKVIAHEHVDDASSADNGSTTTVDTLHRRLGNRQVCMRPSHIAKLSPNIDARFN